MRIEKEKDHEYMARTLIGSIQMTRVKEMVRVKYKKAAEEWERERERERERVQIAVYVVTMDSSCPNENRHTIWRREWYGPKHLIDRPHSSSWSMSNTHTHTHIDQQLHICQTFSDEPTTKEHKCVKHVCIRSPILQ